MGTQEVNNICRQVVRQQDMLDSLARYQVGNIVFQPLTTSNTSFSHGMLPGNLSTPPLGDPRRVFQNFDARSTTIMQEMKTANLAQMSLDDLLYLEVVADILAEKYISYALPCPDWLKKRNREIRRAIIVAIEKEVETAEAELKALEDKETKREAAKDRLAQLRKVLPHG